MAEMGARPGNVRFHCEYLFDGNPVSVSSPRDAAALGIEIVYQDLALCDNLDIVQNMFLGREPKSGLVLDEAQMEIKAAGLEMVRARSVRPRATSQATAHTGWHGSRSPRNAGV